MNNIQWCLKTRPEGEVGREHFEIRETPKPVPGPGQVLVRNIYLLVPASMRIWMNDAPSYFPPQMLGEVMMGITLGVVEASNHAGFKPGQYVNGLGGWQHWFVAPGEALQPVMAHPKIPLAVYRSVLDVQGLTAYAGLTDICKAKAGETLVVTAAAGSVGSLACQIGKKLGMHVIGIAGGADKCRWLVEECGVDAAIDYKNEKVGERLAVLAPKGVDCLFENVGPPIMDEVLAQLAQRARVALCGMVSTYNRGGASSSRQLLQLVLKRARIEGFLVLDYMDRYVEINSKLQAWILDGSLKYQIEIVDGLDRTVEAMSNLFHGRNHGMQLVQITPE